MLWRFALEQFATEGAEPQPPDVSQAWSPALKGSQCPLSPSGTHPMNHHQLTNLGLRLGLSLVSEVPSEAGSENHALPAAAQRQLLAAPQTLGVQGRLMGMLQAHYRTAMLSKTDDLWQELQQHCWWYLQRLRHLPFAPLHQRPQLHLLYSLC